MTQNTTYTWKILPVEFPALVYIIAILIFIFSEYLVFWFLLRSSVSFLALRFFCDGGGEIVFYNWRFKSQNPRIPDWKEPQGSSGLKFLEEALKDLKYIILCLSKYIIFSISLRGEKNLWYFCCWRRICNTTRDCCSICELRLLSVKWLSSLRFSKFLLCLCQIHSSLAFVISLKRRKKKEKEKLRVWLK